MRPVLWPPDKFYYGDSRRNSFKSRGVILAGIHGSDSCQGRLWQIDAKGTRRWQSAGRECYPDHASFAYPRLCIQLRGGPKCQGVWRHRNTCKIIWPGANSDISWLRNHPKCIPSSNQHGHGPSVKQGTWAGGTGVLSQHTAQFFDCSDLPYKQKNEVVLNTSLLSFYIFNYTQITHAMGSCSIL